MTRLERLQILRAMMAWIALMEICEGEHGWPTP